MKIALTQYGRREIVLCSALCASALAAISAAAWKIHPAWSAGLVAPGVLWAWVLWFFRDPQRTCPADAGLLIAPADGVVSDITPVGAQSPLGTEGVKIGIFMNVCNVHVNRSPENAQVLKVDHKKGLFLDARDPDAGEKNESATIYLSVPSEGGKQSPLVVRQVAGLIARRIVTDLTPTQVLKRGQRIGMIKFGSRVEVFAPLHLARRVLVSVGDKTRAGETVIAASGETQ